MKINVKIQNKTFEVQVGDVRARPIPVEVEGEHFEVWPEEAAAPSIPQRQSPSPQTPAPVKPALVNHNGLTANKAGAISAPIPGVIIEIKVSEGESVVYGQELCVLEAMKMKNSIRAGQAGTVAKIHVSAGEQVQQGKLLLELREKAA